MPRQRKMIVAVLLFVQHFDVIARASGQRDWARGLLRVARPVALRNPTCKVNQALFVGRVFVAAQK